MNLYGITRPRLAELIVARGGRPVHAARLWRYVYREGVCEFDAMLDLPPRLRDRLRGDFSIAPLAMVRQTSSSDGLTRKFVLGLDDGQYIETVLMRFDGRSATEERGRAAGHSEAEQQCALPFLPQASSLKPAAIGAASRVTACISSQAGCALGCVFCATGQMGLMRNLSTGEIVAQAVHVDRVLRGMAAANVRGRRGACRSARHTLRNIVLMGMGEPLLNYDAVIGAIEILCDPGGLAIGGKQVTLSTVGVIPGIVRLADEARPVSLAVSLHAATQEERAAMIPAARAWPLDALMEACRYYSAKLGRKIFFEWTLIASKNDSAEHARALARLVRGIAAQINLIPLNPTAGYTGAAGRPEAALRFQAILREHGLPVSFRQRRGIDIAAGCGQLAGDVVENELVVLA